MPDSRDRWHPWRITLFLALGAVLYAGLFLWSDRVLRAQGPQSPFLTLTTAPARTDWLILGASHALPLRFSDMPAVIETQTGQRSVVLATTGAGPMVLRLIAERWFVDHACAGVLIVLDDFGFAAPRWNAARLGDDDLLPKIPADAATARVFLRAVARGLPWQTALAQISGFARINDRTRFAPESWAAEARFGSSPRPSATAIRSRMAFLYPGPAEPLSLDRGMADLAATIQIAQAQGARVVLVRPPLPDGFRAAMPAVPGLEARLDALAQRMAVPLVDHRTAIPEPGFYFDTDHLNRRGVLRWLELGLGALLATGE